MLRSLIVKKYRQNKTSFVERGLPAEGKVLVKAGEVVKSFSKVGECLYSEKSQKISFEGELVKKEGERVFANEVLWVLRKGFLKSKEGKAPFSGIISRVDEEHKTFFIERRAREYSLIAGAPGTIKSVIKNKAVLIETTAIEVFGVFGKGEDVSGELVVVGDYKDSDGVEIDKRHTGKIVACGFVNSYMYSKAKLFGVLGFVCGGVDYGFCESQVGVISLIAVTGFGRLPMDPVLFNYFKGVESRFIVLRPSIPQIIVPEEQSLEWAKGIDGVYTDVREGQVVQIFDQSRYGLTGTVVGIEKDEVKVEVWEEGKILKLSPDSIGVIANP